METKKFNFELVKQHIDTLSSPNEKISYLINEIAERRLYLTNKKTHSGFNRYNLILDDQFIRCCQIEKDKIKELYEIEPVIKAKFNLSKKKGAKTDLIRILNALYELKYIDKLDGQTPSKQEFFEGFGAFLSEDFSDYHSNLSQSLKESSLEANLKVFHDMKRIMQEAHYSSK